MVLYFVFFSGFSSMKGIGPRMDVVTVEQSVLWHRMHSG